MNGNPWIETAMRPKPWRLSQSAWSLDETLSNLEGLAGKFAPISLAQMEGVALLNRIDTKFVMTTRQMASALARVQNNYWMLEVEGNRFNHYRTLYFDTPSFDLYRAHVNKRPERYKVRSREYADSHLSFLEVKHRTRKDRTIKDRLCTEQPVEQMNPNIVCWLQSVSPLDGSLLVPKLWNTFSRLTLVSKRTCERVTLDIDLAFSTDDRQVRLDGIAIAEVKMDLNNRTSPFRAVMNQMRVRERAFSKYAMGVALLYDGVKKNALKPGLLWVEKLMKGSASYE